MADNESYADAWMKWFDIVEAGANPLSRRMIELAQINAADTVLDIGTGIGEPALCVATRPDFEGRVIALDRDAQMLKIGRARALEKAISNVEFVNSDIESLSLDSASLDCILARCSLMFVDNIESTLDNLSKMLRSGGRLVAATWATAEQVPSQTLAKITAHRFLNLDDPEYGQGSPYSLSNRQVFESMLGAAGFVDISSEEFPVRYRYDSAAQYIQNRIDLTGSQWPGMETDSESTREAVFNAITAALAKYTQPDGSIEIENLAICFSGRIP
jgi:ubiquinone/menaquinone biosynthesis C-methylase UbiE